ncbi:MAG: DUF3859 domain-containing protein [Sedimentisphaeraceae bacterium JB056]
MPRKKIEVKMKSYGLYTQWDRDSKELPKILEFTTKIPAKVGIEFGYIINIRGARGKVLDFCIDHPPFKNSQGDLAPAFTGIEHVDSNNFNFFLGDTIWLPVEDKVGKWELTCHIEGKQLAQKSFDILLESEIAPDGV